MNQAPAVTYLVGPSLFQRALAALLLLPGVLTILIWLMQTPFTMSRWVLSITVLVLGALLAWRHWQHDAQQRLRWDGQSWCLLDDAETTGEVQVRLDWQSGLLLTFHANGQRPRWLWLSRTSSPARWLDVRRAVWAPARWAGDKLAWKATAP